MESLHRTLASAQAPALQQDFESNSSEQKSTLEIVESSLIQHASDQDDGESSAEETTKIERDFFDEADDQEEDVSGEDSCTSDNTEFFSSSYKNSYNDILRSVICEHNGDHNSLVLPILAPIRQNLVERIMDEFWLIFSQDWVAQIIRCPRDSSTSGDSKYRGTPVEKASLFKPQQKRQRSHEEDSPDGNDDKKPRRQRDGPRPLSKFNNLVRFGCPFRKHDPQRYSIHSHRVCALTPWDTIARVK
jgi:hypothetical protein